MGWLKPRTVDREQGIAMDAGRSRRPRRIGRSLALAAPAVVLGVLGLSGGCTTTVRPPGGVREPARVVLLDHGRHASLVLPGADGRMVRYAYGDWSWYARRRTGVLEAFPTLLWPTRGTLGRRVLGGGEGSEVSWVEGVEHSVAEPIEHWYVITVERSHVDALRRELEQIYEQHSATRIVNSTHDLDFVHHPESYCYFNNCNHVTARWLRRLGCEIDGLAFRSRWKLRLAEPRE